MTAETGSAGDGGRLRLALGGAGLVALLFTSQLYVWINWWPIRIGWGTALLWSLPQLLVWAALVPLVVAAARRWPVEGPTRFRRLLAHGGGSLALGLGGLLLLDLSDRLTGWSVALGAPGSLLTNLKYTIIHLHMGVAVYWVTLAVTHAARYQAGLAESRERALALSSALAEAQLSALRAQLHPHFLFNTLNGIAVAIRQDPATAELMVHRLSGLLRSTLETADIPEVTLAEELAAAAAYLDIEQARFGGRLRTVIELPEECRACLVPSFLLQPLVENAVRYAVAPRAGGGEIRLRAGCDGGRLLLQVEDDGPGFAGRPAREGVGLGHTRRRLATHYGAAASLETRDRPGGGAEVRIELPAREPAPDPEAARC